MLPDFTTAPPILHAFWNFLELLSRGLLPCTVPHTQQVFTKHPIGDQKTNKNCQTAGRFHSILCTEVRTSFSYKSP